MMMALIGAATLTASPSAQMLGLARQAALAAGSHLVARAGAAVEATKADARDLVTAVDGECQQIIEEYISSKYPDHTVLGEESIEPGWAAASIAAGRLKEVEWSWIIDPVDGTTNFVSQLPLCVVSIGIARYGIPHGSVVYDPHHNEMFSAWTGEGATLNGNSMRVSSTKTLASSVVCAPCPHSSASMGPAMRSIQAVIPRARSVRILGSGVLNLAWVACGRLEAYWEHELAVWDTAAGSLLVQEAGGQVTGTDGTPFTLTSRGALATNAAIHEEMKKLLLRANALKCD